jgi:hypothetical protein
LPDAGGGVTAAAWAQQQAAAVRDDPAARIALVARSYRGPFGRPPGTCPGIGRTTPASDEYPLTGEVRHYLSNELGFGRLLDYGVILPRLQVFYEWSAHELSAPGLLDCIREGTMTYAWPFTERDVWRPRKSLALRLAHRALPSGRPDGR